MNDVILAQALSAEQIDAVHNNSTRILNEIGVSVPNAEVLAIFERGGAQVDHSRQIVKLPKALLDSCIERQIENGRRTRADHPESERIPFTGTMATQPFLFDDASCTRRAGTLSDMLLAITLGNHLPSVRRVSCLVIPGEYPSAAADALSFFLLYMYAAKPVFSWVYSLDSARCIIEMAKAVARDPWHLRSGELLEYNVETVSPLRFAAHSLQIMLECAKSGIPMSCGPMLVMGSSAPMSHLATMTMENAEILATLAAIMLISPENPRFDYIAPAHSMSMTNGMCSFGSPNQALFAIMARQMADFYGFDRVVVNCGLSDALYPDYQSGIERGVTLACAMAAGIDETGLMGIVGADQAASFEQLAIDDELLGTIGRIANRGSGSPTASLKEITARVQDIKARHNPPSLAIARDQQEALQSILGRHLGDELTERFTKDLQREEHRS